MRKFSERGRNEIEERCRTGIEDFLEHVEQLHHSRLTTFKPEEIAQQRPQELTEQLLKFIYAQYLAKYTELVDSLIEAANNQSYMVFALCGRSLIETTAILRYYTFKLKPLIEEAVRDEVVTLSLGKRIIDTLDQHARGGRFNWVAFHLEDRSEFARTIVESKKTKRQNPHSKHQKSNPDQVNIQTAIENWSREHNGVMLIYDYFCELVHPNLGSNLLVMGESTKQLTIGGSSNKKVAARLFEDGLGMVAASAIRDGSKYMGILFLLAWGTP